MAIIKLSEPKKLFRSYKRYKPWLEKNFYYFFCGYCLTTHSYLEIDHHEPKAMSPQKENEYSNLLLSCRNCNGKAGKSDYHHNNKFRTRMPDRSFRLLDIRSQDMSLMYQINESSGELIPKKNEDFENSVGNILLLNLNSTHNKNTRRNFISGLRQIETLMSLTGMSKLDQLKVDDCISDLITSIEKFEFFFYVLGVDIDERIMKMFRPERERAVSIC